MFTWLYFYCSFRKHSINLAEMWQMFWLSFRVLWTDLTKFPTCQKLDEKWLFYFWGYVHSLYPHHQLLLIDGHTTTEFEKPLKNCSIFPSLVQSLIQTLNSHTCYNLITSRKWLSTLCLHLVVKFVLPAIVSFCDQPRNYLIAPCLCIFTNKT
jgi:hypothetical protein